MAGNAETRASQQSLGAAGDALAEQSWRRCGLVAFPPTDALWALWLRRGDYAQRLNISDAQLCMRARKLARALDLSRNHLRELQSSIQAFVNLRVLNLDYNHKLECLPRELGSLSGLEALSVVGCALEYLPATLSLLPQLSTLNASNNRLKSFLMPPPSSLRICKLRENKLTSLPQDFDVCKCTLQVLDVSHNPLTIINCDLGLFTNLTILKLAHCELMEVPRGIGRLRALQKLVLFECTGDIEVSVLPFELHDLTQLRELDFCVRGLTQVPRSFLQCRCLEKLYLPIIAHSILQKQQSASPHTPGYVKQQPQHNNESFNLISVDAVAELLRLITGGQHFPLLHTLNVSCDTRLENAMSNLLLISDSEQIGLDNTGIRQSYEEDMNSGAGDTVNGSAAHLSGRSRRKTLVDNSELSQLQPDWPSKSSRTFNASLESLAQNVFSSRRQGRARQSSLPLRTNVTALISSTSSQQRPLLLNRARNASFGNRTTTLQPSSSFSEVIGTLRRAVTIRGKRSSAKKDK